ncbi:MAG: beta strand repeat-containing protein [Rhodoluna sp.]
MVSVSSDAYDAAGHTGVNLTGSAGSDVATAANGVATFANLRLEGVVASAYRLNLAVQNTVGYNGIATNQNIALTAGTSTQLRVLQQPAAIVAGVAFASAVKVEILDAWNNRVLDAPSSITVKPTLVADSGASTVVDSSKSAVANSSGLVTFTGLTFTKAGTQYIEFTSTGLTSVVSDSFVITNAEADHLAWVTSPVAAKNDYAVKGAGSSDPELEVRDAFENPVLTGAATSVSVAVQPANTDVLAISGASATSDSSARIKFSNLVLRAKVGSYTLRFRAANGSLPVNGTHLDSLAPVAISFGDPTALNLTRSAAGANSGVPFTTQPRLNIEDSAGNVVADSTLAVTISETETQVLSGTVTRAAVAGSVDFTDSGAMFTGAAANGLTLKYAVTYNGSEISTTQSINLTAGAAVALTIGQQPTDVRTRDAFSPVPTVVLRDAAGNRVYSDSTSTVTAQLLDASGSPVGNPTAAFTAASGLVTFAGLSFTAPSTDGYSITYKLTSNNQTVTSSLFEILPGAATELRVTTAPSTVEADQSTTKTGELLPSQPVVKLYDFDGNLVTTTNTGVATIRVKSGVGASLSSGQTTATFSGGVATFTGVKLVGTPGVDYVLEFTSANPTLTSAGTSALRVAHNVVDHISLTQAAAGGRAGSRFTTQPIVTIQDRYGNTVTDGEGSDFTIHAAAAITAQNGVPLTTPLDIQASNADEVASGGVATFGALTISGLVSNTYALTYSAGSQPRCRSCRSSKSGHRCSKPDPKS